jgi:catechol 2,3-dioxygenase-like lactoylglutathione lyase family enzyme
MRCATILCDSLERATTLYAEGLGLRVLEQGEVTPALAQSWGTPAMSGARMALMGVDASAATLLRFVEDLQASHPPYKSLGWQAIEFSVQSSDATIARMAAAGFEVLAPAADLEFSKGALRAGQAGGPFGEVLYITQINDQLPDYTLPQATIRVDRLFIAILGVHDVDASYAAYDRLFGAIGKPTFEAAVDFVNRAQDMPEDYLFNVGCLELVPESYIEVDTTPTHIAPRGNAEGKLPCGIAMISITGGDRIPAATDAVGGSVAAPGMLYANGSSFVVRGIAGELIEVLGA